MPMPDFTQKTTNFYAGGLDRVSHLRKDEAWVAEKLSATPTRMVERDWQPLRELGFGDEGCLEVAHIVGMFNHLTRMADGFGLQLDASTIAATEGDALPPLGG